MPETSPPIDAIAAARTLRPRIIELRSETEKQRQLPDTIVAALIESGICRIALPSELGGLELNPVLALEVFEELATSDASVAWVVWNTSLPCFFGRFLSGSTAVFVRPSSITAPSGMQPDTRVHRPVTR